MNYRHAFHAGNFADCVKHALLVWLLRALARKAAPFFVLDTHAGTGRYDLGSDAAQRSGEWHDGIGRLLADPAPPLADYVALVERLGLYPGSPVLIRALLRENDRLACCELHPEDVVALRRAFMGDPQVAVHYRDGWEAVTALLPPPQRRGLVLIDPPFEARDEYARIVAAFRSIATRFSGGIVAAWYPIKHRAPVRAMQAALQEAGITDLISAELWLRPPLDPARLNGCGLLVRHPPWQFETGATAILAALCDRLGSHDSESSYAVQRVTDE